MYAVLFPIISFQRYIMVYRITTTIKQQWLIEILAGRKKIEYREIKPYWTKKLKGVTVPFDLRLINGMRSRAPEATVRIIKVIKNLRSNEYQLHIGKVLNRKYCKAFMI
jgi:hypothetical protein